MWAGPFPAGPRRPGRRPSRSWTPAGTREIPRRPAGGSRPQVSNPESGLPSRRLPEVARDSVVHLKGDGYPFEDRDLGRVLRPAL